ncbi:formyl transferase [Burkholderia lata]|uniref:Formyl transferase n=1 Tax=Burkholderia lata (strain ATCC 17760 / DSM 23089 / LMG 22485 / NCIMB 9086 / R18194 / 383) TaxID=482957 RepID=A0A6P2SZQ9_BURL3|nr:formyltransferase family protein [Burkholderia lata]VWC56466.1 formyl transferase [Burkholderia lata]
MRFALAGFDLFHGVLETFASTGWTPVSLFSFVTDGQVNSNTEIVSYATRHGVPLQLSRIDEAALRALRDLDCDVLVVAGYHWRIPDWTPYVKHAINFHPAPLPDARGPYPQMRAILDGRREWAVTCHRIAPDFDTGEILARERFALAADECHESLQLKVQMAGCRLARQVAYRFDALWAARAPQTGGSYWPKPVEADRTLDFTRPVDDVMTRVRANGLHECIAHVAGGVRYVRRAVGWHERHAYAPGSIAHTCRRWTVVAVPDGFVALLEWSAVSLSVRTDIGP